MGGKDKQRTKGNLKPSSSGRAAALISKDGTVGFVGFGGLQGTPGASNLGYVPMAAGVSEDVDACVDPEFRIVMRKLMKRDAVTKLKAVQEFTDLCKNSTVQAVESALPFWPRLFNKLAMDVDHRVREATQQAMEQLVLRVGRNLAPHLRYVIGPWLCAQFDTYAVVASSGRKSFQAAFSEEKQAGVIKFCRKELFEFLQDNILTQTSSTLSDPKFVSEEEREAKYNRVLSSSILVLGHLVHVTSSDKENADMEELYLNVLRQNKFWKYARHKSPNVRAAVFSTVSIACESLPSMMLSLSSQASPAVLSALDDSDPAVCQQLWNAVLSVLKNITDCWKQVNVRKAVLPKLWSVLKSGGSGCATVIFPNLLPFLSKVPAEVIGSGVGFYKEFFTSQQEGLMKERVQNSPSECSAVIAAFMECLRFCLLRGFDGDGPDVTVLEYLIKEQLLSVLKSSLEKQSKLSQSNLYPLVAELLSYLSSKSENDSKLDEVLEEQKTPQPYHHMLEWFWQGFSSVCLENLQSVVGKVVSDEVINSVSHCLVTLKLPSKNKKKQLKVAFTEPSSEPFDNDSSEIEKRCSSMESFAGSADVENLYNGCILDLVCNACSLCLDEVSQNNSLLHLKLLSRLVPHFTSTKLMKTLLEKTRSEQSSICSEPDNDNYSELSEQFLTHTLFCWIENVPFGGDIGQVSGVFSDRRSLDYLVSIFCGIVRTLPIVKQVDLVSQSLQQNTAVRFVYKVLEEGLHSEVPGVVKWLQSEQGSERLLELSRCLVLHVGQDVALCAEDRKTVWKIIKLCIVTEQHVAKLENELVDKICQHFLRLLRQSPQEHEQELPLLLDILQTYLAHCEKNPSDIVHSIEELLLALFHLQLTNVVSYSSAAAQSLTETWQTGLRVLKQLPSEMDSTPCQTLLLKTAVLVQEKLQTVQTLKRVDDLATIAVQLLQDAINLSPAEESDGESLSQRVFVALTPSEQQLNLLRNEYSKSQWLLDPLIERKLPVMSDFHDCLDECENVRSTLTNHQKMMVFSSSLLKEILSNSKESTPDLKSEVVTRDCFLRLLLETNWVRHWCICVLGYSDSTEEYIAYSDISDQTVSNLLVKLQQTTQQLLEHVKEKQWSEAVLADALTRSRSEGFLWCVVLGGVLKDLQQLDVPYEPAVLLAEVQSLASLEEKECQTLNTLISHVNGIYELKVITEQYTRLLREENDEGGFARVLAVIDGSLHQWFKRTEGVEEALLEYQLTLTEILDELVEWNKTHDDLVLINSPLHDASMSVLSLNLSLIRILEMAVLHCSDKMNREHWDFALCCLAGWLQTCEENRIILTTSLKSVALCCQVCSLFCVVVRFFQENASKLSKLSDDGNSSEASHEVESESSVTADNAMFPPNLFAEWQEFFSGSLFSTVLRLFLFYAAQCQSSHFEVSFWSTRIGESLGKAVIYTPTALLTEHKFEGPPPATAEESTNMPQWIGDLLGNCLPLLKSSIHDLQFAGYHLLSKVMAQISLLDDQEPEPEEGVDEPIRSPPTSLIVLINDACAHMAEMVSEAHVPFGEHLDMTSDTEAQNASLSLMLAWKLMLQFFRSLPQERRVEYAKFIRQNKMVGDLLGVLFRLIPLKATATAGVMVADDFEPEIGRFAGQRTIQQLACGIYYYLSQWMPAIVRQWWNGLDKRQSGIVDKFTISSITPQLCQREMQLVQSSSIRFDNMQVKTRPSAREVAAVYTVDEISMELVVKLAPNHPLGVVSVESGKKIGVTAAQWRSWMLQMTTFLTHQNGSIMDGLILWKRNVDKRFEGIEDCMICFSVIHGSNYSLPKLSCKTCKKKFHSACLYKWFSTSNNATCPLCRNLF